MDITVKFLVWVIFCMAVVLVIGTIVRKIVARRRRDRDIFNSIIAVAKADSIHYDTFPSLVKEAILKNLDRNARR